MDPVLPMAPLDEFTQLRPPRESLDIDRSLLRIGRTVNIPVSNSAIVFAQANGSFVAVGSSIYNLRTGAEVGKVNRDMNGDLWRTLSADGRYYAVGDRNVIEVWDCTRGDRIARLQPDRWVTDALIRPTHLQFLNQDQLLSSEQGSRIFLIWSISAGTVIGNFEAPNRGYCVFGADGRFLALITGRKDVVVYDLTKSDLTRNEVAVAHPQVTGHSSYLDGLRFSSDGNELAAVSNENGTRILCWKESAQLVFECTVAQQRSSWTGAADYAGEAIE